MEMPKQKKKKQRRTATRDERTKWQMEDFIHSKAKKVAPEQFVCWKLNTDHPQILFEIMMHSPHSRE